MKKLFIMFALLAFSTVSAYAAGMVYDPTEYQVDEKTNTIGTKKMPTNNEVLTNIQTTSNIAQDTVSAQSENFNNALFELDSAQVNIRNELLDYKAKYQEIDTQYQLIKEQRKVLARQIKSIEKRVNAIERSKNHIRKNML